MTAYRFTARSTTPGEYRLAPGVLELLIAAADVRKDVNRGDGTLGSLAVVAIPTPTGTDPVMDLADLLAANLTALGIALGTGGVAAFAAAWKSDPVAELASATLSTAAVWVVDFTATHQPAEPSSGGIALEEFELLVILQRKILETETADTVCRTMSRYAAEIAAFCRKTILDPGSSGNGAVCYKCDRPRARDFKDWHQADLYRAEISTHWQRGFLGDE